jgi:excisionase family DNA binding protein
MEQFKVELPKEVTDAIKVEVLNTFKEAKNDVYQDKYPVYLSKKQACKYLNISNKTLDEWIEKEDIPYKHIGKTYRFNRNDLDKFMATK